MIVNLSFVSETFEQHTKYVGLPVTLVISLPPHRAIFRTAPAAWPWTRRAIPTHPRNLNAKVPETNFVGFVDDADSHPAMF